MHNNESDDPRGKMILGHEPVKGYRPVFLIAFTVAVAYLAYVLYSTL